MKEPISFFVTGEPKGQPRPRACIRGKRAGVYDPGTAVQWKACVGAAWIRYQDTHGPVEPHAGPVALALTFTIARPASHYGSGKNAAMLKPSAPAIPTGKPDFDNLAKAVADELTNCGAWRDDAQISSCIIRKRYADTAAQGCRVTITEDAA